MKFNNMSYFPIQPKPCDHHKKPCPKPQQFPNYRCFPEHHCPHDRHRFPTYRCFPDRCFVDHIDDNYDDDFYSCHEDHFDDKFDDRYDDRYDDSYDDHDEDDYDDRFCPDRQCKVIIIVK